MSKIPTLNEMLKLYTKKDLWERIQHHIKRIDNLQSQLDQQKAMWNELKEFVGKYADNYDESISSICYLILDKIKELEQGEKNVKD